MSLITSISCSFPLSSIGVRSAESRPAASAAFAVTRISPALAAEASRAVVFHGVTDGGEFGACRRSECSHPRVSRVYARPERNPRAP